MYKIPTAAVKTDSLNRVPKRNSSSSGTGSPAATLIRTIAGELPTAPPAPEVKGVMQGAALLCWPPLGQGITRVVIQAMPVKNAKAEPNYKKFSAKAGGCVAIVTVAADKVASEVLSGLKPGTFYCYRMIVSNQFGAVEGTSTAPIRTPHAEVQASKLESDTDGGSTATAAVDGTDTRRRRSTFFSRRKKDKKESSKLGRASASSAATTEAAAAVTAAANDAAEVDNLPRSPRPSTILATSPTPEEAEAEKNSRAPTPPGRHIKKPVFLKEQPPAFAVSSDCDGVPELPSSAAPSPKTSKSDIALPKSVSSRLGSDVAERAAALASEPSMLEQEEKRRREATKLFKQEDAPGAANAHSRIYNALNPAKLYYESRREREETEEAGPDRIQVRGVSASAEVVRDYALPRDEEGNLVANSNDSESKSTSSEEAVDPNNLPDFGEYQKEMDAMRKQREQELEARRSKMKAEHEAKKAEERRRIEDELESIKAKEAKQKKAVDVSADDVAAAQQRVAEEAAKYMQFTFSG